MCPHVFSRPTGTTTRTAVRTVLAGGVTALLLAALVGAPAHSGPLLSPGSLSAAQPGWSGEAVPITLTGASATSPSGNVRISGGEVMITAPGAYEISGRLDDGYVKVDSPGAGGVSLILTGADISNSTNSPLQIAAADEVVIVLADGSRNRLADATRYVHPDPQADEPNAALFSKSDLIIRGNGSLTVQGNANDGITSKTNLVIESGTIVVNSVDDGIRGKDSLVITGGNITVTAQDDGLKSDRQAAGKGRIAISTGTVQVSAGDDAIRSENMLAISGGSVTVTESYEALESRQITISGGTVDVTARDDAINAVEEGVPEFAVAPNAFVNISGGTVLVNADIDGIDSNGTVNFSGGTVVINGPVSGSPGEGAIDANGAVNFRGGTVFGAASTSLAVLSVPPTDGQGWVAPRFTASQPAGTMVHLVSQGQVLVSYRAPKAFREVVFSADSVSNGQSYDVYTGGNVSGDLLGGMTTGGGSIAGATHVMTVTAGEYRGGMTGWPPPPGGGPWDFAE